MDRLTMLFIGVTKLKIEAEIGHSITNVEVKFGLTEASGPNLDNFLQATQEEGFFCVVGAGLGGGVVHFLCLVD